MKVAELLAPKPSKRMHDCKALRAAGRRVLRIQHEQDDDAVFFRRKQMFHTTPTPALTAHCRPMPRASTTGCRHYQLRFCPINLEVAEQLKQQSLLLRLAPAKALVVQQLMHARH